MVYQGNDNQEIGIIFTHEEWFYIYLTLKEHHDNLNVIDRIGKNLGAN